MPSYSSNSVHVPTCFVVLLLVWISLYSSACVWDLRQSRTVKDPMTMVSHNITEVWHSFLHHINAVFCILSIGAINCCKTNLTINFFGIFNHFYRFGLWWWASCVKQHTQVSRVTTKITAELQSTSTSVPR